VEASEGTLFLDEVGELPPAAQVKLLRAIQENEIEPIGARKPVKVDVRLISATNRDLIADVKAGRFREDLFYRLHVFPISIPPLRERAQDIPELARHFLLRFAAEEGKRVTHLSAEALSLLCTYHWPGNVRQLENAVFRAVVLAEGDTIGLHEFPQIASHAPDWVSAGSEAPALAASPADDEDRREDEIIRIESANVAPPAAMGPVSALDLLDDNGDVRPLEDIEADAIRFAITHYRGQMSEVARRLRIGRSTLYRKLDSLGVGGDPKHVPSPSVTG
jgi:DNA-binding NtrC family response regulator